MKKTSKVAGLLAVALVVSGIGFSQGAAQAAGNGGKHGHVAREGVSKVAKELKLNVQASAATLLGLTPAELEKQLNAMVGQTLASFATSITGWTTEEFVAKLVEAETANIDAAVTAGTLTADQATAAKASLSERITAEVTKVYVKKAKDPAKSYKIKIIDSVATLLGVTTEDLKTKLHATAGQTLAGVATEIKGWTTDEFVANWVAAETANIDAAVTAGTLTADQATTLKATLSADLNTLATEVHDAQKDKPAGKGHKEDQDEKEGKGHKGEKDKENKGKKGNKGNREKESENEGGKGGRGRH
jgi:hypothetical protein